MADTSGEDFQARGVTEGRAVQDMAGRVLTGAGFVLGRRNFRWPDVGALVNFEATDAAGEPWYFDVSGAFTTSRPGLARTDTMWKTLGRANVLAGVGAKPLVFVTTNLPPSDSTGGKALRAARHTYFDAVEMMTKEGRSRLSAYASGQYDRPLPGFLTPKDVFGSSLKTGGALGALYEVPIARVGDPLGKLHDDYEITGLDHCLKVVVPTIARDGSTLGSAVLADAVVEIKRLLHDHGGGCTTQSAEGSWTDPIAGVVHENVLVLETYASTPFGEPVIRPIVELILRDLDQEVAAITLNEKMLHFPR